MLGALEVPSAHIQLAFKRTVYLNEVLQALLQFADLGAVALPQPLECFGLRPRPLAYTCLVALDVLLNAPTMIN